MNAEGNLTKAQVMEQLELFGLPLANVEDGIPVWLQKVLHEEFPMRFQRPARDVCSTGAWWEAGCDHCRTYKKDVAIWQPYFAHTEPLLDLLTSLDRRGIQSEINGCSPYFPGRTLSIVIWRPEDEELALELIINIQDYSPQEQASTKLFGWAPTMVQP
jgi:hypothetical protein